MADKILNVRLRQKYDTEANWTSNNPVLLVGEMAVSSDKNGQFKIGNGTSKWSQLAYNQIPWTSVTGRPTSLKNPTALNIQFNGVAQDPYDGSVARTYNITPAAIGAATSGHSHSAATTTAAGLLTAADKKKLDGIAANANNYVHPNSGVTAGTYRSITVNAQGHITGGTNPTTLSGYGITDAAAKVHTHTKSQITDMPTSLKNPEILNILFNGMPWTYYDGSSRVEIDVTPGNIGAADAGDYYDLRDEVAMLKNGVEIDGGGASTTYYENEYDGGGATG